MNADEVRRGWATRSAEYSPGYYAYYGPDETSELVRRTLAGLVDPDGAVLEVGCSAGRHLKHLHDHGFTDLHGLDINEDAFDVLGEEYPALAADGTFYRDAIEDAVGAFADGRFDAVFTVETLQHVHADDAWVFAELARVTDDVLLTVECEGPGASVATDGPERDSAGERPHARDRPDPAVSYENGDFPLYYRPWRQIFTTLGLCEVTTRPAGDDTLRAFRHA